MLSDEHFLLQIFQKNLFHNGISIVHIYVQVVSQL